LTRDLGYVPGEGIFAEDRDTRAHLSGSSRELHSEVENHVDWEQDSNDIHIDIFWSSTSVVIEG
jgi:hypothetical protein